MSLWLSEDADAGMILLQRIEHVVVQWLCAFLRRENDGRTADVLQVDSGDRQAHHGTEVELKLAQEELYAPEPSTGQRLGYFAGNMFSLLQSLLRKLEWLPTLTVVATLLYVSDRWAEEGRAILLGYGEEGEL